MRGMAASSADAATMAMPPPDPGLLPGQTFGAYRIETKLGEGGMGVVYRAVHGTLERLVALKIMRPELASDAGYAERFLREARAAAAVCHQHAVILFDAGTVEGRLYMAFQFVPGGDLDQLVEQHGAQEPDKALAIIAACCEGLEAIHEAGLLHRDIKPHNIFLDAQGRPRLGDFGLARQAEGGDRMTLTGMGMGTPAYMAPEQAQGSRDLDGRADIYALGSTLFHLLTGRAPYTGATPWVVVNAVCNDPPPDPRLLRPELPACCAELVMRAMAKDPAQRFPSPAAFRAAIVACRQPDTGAAPVAAWQPTTENTSLLGPFTRRGWVWLAVPLVVILLLPLALNPLLVVNPGYQPLSHHTPAWWAWWMGLGVLSAALLWVPLRLRQAPPCAKSWLLLPLLLAAVTCSVVWGLTGQALVSIADGGHAWSALTWIVSVAIGIALIALAVRAWSRLALLELLRRALLPPLQLGLAALLALLISHLAIAQRPQVRTVKEDGLAGVLGRLRSEPTWNTEVPWLLNLATPLALTLVVPAILVRRRRPA